MIVNQKITRTISNYKMRSYKSILQILLKNYITDYTIPSGWKLNDMQGGYGWIYFILFPSGKFYAGQTINIINRMSKYRRHTGSNSHLTNALKKYNFINILIISAKYPTYILDSIEIYLINRYNLIDDKFGYNKTTGGKNIGYTRAFSSNHKISGENHYLYGKHLAPEIKNKISLSLTGPKNHQFGKTGKLSTNYGKKWSDDHHKKHKNFGLLKNAKINQKKHGI